MALTTLAPIIRDQEATGSRLSRLNEPEAGRMSMLAETVDAVIGIDTHRDSHEVEIADADRQLSAEVGRDQVVHQVENRRLAIAVAKAWRELKDHRAQLLAIVDDIAPGLTSRYGAGPVSAAQVVVSFSHPGRCGSEAAFAALSGTSPIPVSSGKTIRHRLNRGGDRALYRATRPSYAAVIRLAKMSAAPRAVRRWRVRRRGA
jgi:transposase